MPRFLALLAALVCLLPRGAVAQPATPVSEKVAPGDEALYSCKPRTSSVTVSFKPETDVKDLLAWVMGFTCKRFMLDPRIVTSNRKVTLVVPDKMTPAEAYNLFLGALSTISLAVVAKDGAMVVVEAQSAKREVLPIYTRDVPSGEQVVRYVYKPQYVGGEVLHQAFTGLKSDLGDVVVVGSLLLVTDYGRNVHEMMTLAKIVDVPGGSDGIYTIPVPYGDAAKIAEKINQLLSLPSSGAPAPPAGPGGKATEVATAVPSKVLVDERTNTLILAGTEAAYLRVKSVVERIAIPIEVEGGASINVYPLSGAIAKELADTLTAAIGSSPAPSARPPGQPAPPASAADTLGASLQGNVRIIADQATNALIVMSSGRDYLAIRNVIKQLDQPRRQVYIEAVVLEVQLDDNLDLGTVAHGALPIPGGSAIAGGFETSTMNSLTPGSTLGAATGLIGGLIGKALDNSQSLLGQSIPSYAVLFQALGHQVNAKVISSPSIIAVDNADAKFKVELNLPYKKGVVLPSNNTGFPTQQNDFAKLPLILNLKPHISANDMVFLELTHQSTDLAGMDKELGPTYTIREIETRVVVRDQQTVAISGLIQEREEVTTTKVPLLGDIPLLGYLFKTKSKQKHKSNLLILLTPYVMKDQFDLELLQQRKQREAQEFARAFTSLDRMEYTPAIDYRKKRGLIEEINRAVQTVEEDVAARAALGKTTTVEPGLIQTH